MTESLLPPPKRSIPAPRLHGRFALAATLLVVMLVLAGCGTGGYEARMETSQAALRAGGFDTPDLAFQAYDASLRDRNWQGYYLSLTPESREELIGGVCTMLIVAGETHSDVRLFFDEQDTPWNSIRAVSFPENPADRPKYFQEVAGKRDEALAKISDKIGFLSGALNRFSAKLIETKQKNIDWQAFDPNPMGGGELRDLAIQDDVATGKVATKKDDDEIVRPIEFQKIDGRWFVELRAFKAQPAGTTIDLSDAAPKDDDSGVKDGEKPATAQEEQADDAQPEK